MELPCFAEVLNRRKVRVLVSVFDPVNVERHVGKKALHRSRLPRHDACLRPVLCVRRSRVLTPAPFENDSFLIFQIDLQLRVSA